MKKSRIEIDLCELGYYWELRDKQGLHICSGGMSLTRDEALIDARDAQYSMANAGIVDCFHCRFYWWDVSATIYQGCKRGVEFYDSCNQFGPRTKWQKFWDKIFGD